MPTIRTAIAASAAALSLTLAAGAAQKLVATVAHPNFDVPGAGNTQIVNFPDAGPVNGVGMTALWIGVVADKENGIAPWSLDLEALVTPPAGPPIIDWDPIGGEVSYADYPLQDFSPALASAVPSAGNWSIAWDSVGPPWIAGLRDVRMHLTTTVADVAQVFTGSVASGPTWSRPFSIVGISGLGPVVYSGIEFRVTESGGYTITSTVPTGNNFLAIYKDSFNSTQSLTNLFDYDVGNGPTPPAGTSVISAMLFEGETYYLINAQFSASQPGQAFTNNIVGPGSFVAPCPGDMNGDSTVDVDDLNEVLSNWGTTGPQGDANNDLTVNVDDLNEVLSNWGNTCSTTPNPVP